MVQKMFAFLTISVCSEISLKVRYDSVSMSQGGVLIRQSAGLGRYSLLLLILSHLI